VAAPVVHAIHITVAGATIQTTPAHTTHTTHTTPLPHTTTVHMATIHAQWATITAATTTTVMGMAMAVNITEVLICLRCMMIVSCIGHKGWGDRTTGVACMAEAADMEEALTEEVIMGGAIMEEGAHIAIEEVTWSENHGLRGRPLRIVCCFHVAILNLMYLYPSTIIVNFKQNTVYYINPTALVHWYNLFAALGLCMVCLNTKWDGAAVCWIGEADVVLRGGS